MLDELLNSDNPLVRYGFAVLIVFGSLYFASSIGLLPFNVAWIISVIILVMVLMRHIGRNGATFRP